MKKLLIITMVCITLFSCGKQENSPTPVYSESLDETDAKSSIESETESNNLYETENLVTKTIGNVEYQIPENWDKSCKNDGGYTYYYDDGLILMVYNEKFEGMLPIDELSESQKDEYKQSLMEGMKTGFDKYEEISNSIYLGKQHLFLYQADVELQNIQYKLNEYVVCGNDEIYSLGFLVSDDSKKDYKREIRALGQSITLNQIQETDNSNENSNSEVISQLKELYKQQASDLDYSESDSKTYFEIVLKSSKELSKRGEGAELEEFVGDTLFNPFVLSAGYLCNNYDDDTEYGKVGNMAFDLIGYIVAKDEESRDKILNEFDTIAAEHGMEIITIDDSEIKSEEQRETESQEPMELSTGSYIVGEDIPAGKYDIVGIKHGYLSLCSVGKDYGDILGEIIESGETVYANARLENGQTLKIESGGKVQLQPK